MLGINKILFGFSLHKKEEHLVRMSLLLLFKKSEISKK
jgi:hypothetical protein